MKRILEEQEDFIHFYVGRNMYRVSNVVNQYKGFYTGKLLGYRRAEILANEIDQVRILKHGTPEELDADE